KAIINSAVETNSRSPVSRVPNVKIVLEPPVSGRPKESFFGWENPRSWHPEVSIIAVRPIAGLPDVAGPRADRLPINRQNRRRNANGNHNADISACFCFNWRSGKHQGTSEDQRTEQTGDAHKSHLSGVGWALCFPARPVARGARRLKLDVEPHGRVVVDRRAKNSRQYLRRAFLFSAKAEPCGLSAIFSSYRYSLKNRPHVCSWSI